MSEMDRWIEHRTRMKSAGKMLIIGALVVEVALGTYFVIERERDDSNAANSETARDEALTPAAQVPRAPVTSQSSADVLNGHRTESVAPPPILPAAKPSSANDISVKAVPQPTATARTVQEPAAQIAQPNKSKRRQQAGLKTQHQKTKPDRKHHVVAGSKQKRSKAAPSLDQQGRNPVASAMTDQLVKQSTTVPQAGARYPAHDAGASTTGGQSARPSAGYGAEPPTLRGRK
ncbi:hypothetical protein AAGS40_22540 [Paraburkholderia sp. PREW-6R]|uniref:hypothetical protein n=1 Tax=Paraburkholderia sp. PREW-6R TaxID=3141544 RepID=UPI0031F5B872